MTLTALKLPNNPQVKTSDPLGLCEEDLADDDGNVPVWFIFRDLLLSYPFPTNPSQLVELLDTLAYTIHLDSSRDFGCLLQTLGREDIGQKIGLSESQDLWDDFIPAVLNLALKLQHHFQDGTLKALTPNETRSYTRRQCAVLVAHQFLGTLSSPSWNDWGGVNLYQWFEAGGQEHIKEAYICLVLRFLNKVISSTADSAYSKETMDFTYHQLEKEVDFDSSDNPLLPLSLLEYPTERDYPAEDFEAHLDAENSLLISCHSHVGHGSTATQEERIIASYPEILPISAFTPPLSPTASLIIRCKQPFQPVGKFVGHGRSAELEHDNKDVDANAFKTFIFIDASQLDVEESENGELPDFKKGFLERDAIKAYTGFIGALSNSSSESHRLYTIPWGAGAFGGNLMVKFLLLWLASSKSAANAGKASMEMIFSVRSGVLEQSKSIVDELRMHNITIEKLWRALIKVRSTYKSNTQSSNTDHEILKFVYEATKN